LKLLEGFNDGVEVIEEDDTGMELYTIKVLFAWRNLEKSG